MTIQAGYPASAADVLAIGTAANAYTDTSVATETARAEAAEAVLVASGGPATLTTLTLTGSVAAGKVLASPSGAAGAPTFRALVATDLAGATSPFAPSEANIAALRAATTTTLTQAQCYVLGYYATSDGGEGTFAYMSSDTTNADNGGTIIVDASGRRWHRQVKGQSLNVRWFGAKLDGTTNDQPACLNCSTALIAAGAGKITIPAGSLRLGSVWQIAANGIWLEGAGSEATVIINATTNAAAIQFGSGTTSYYRCSLTNMSFAQASGVTPVAGNAGLALSYQDDFVLREVQMYPYPSALYAGIILNHCAQTYMSSVGVESCLNAGIYMSFQNGIFASNCNSDANGGNGWSLVDSGGYMLNCTAYGNTGSAWALNTAGTNMNLNWFFVNCIGDTSGSYNWSINQLANSYFTNCWGSTQLSATTNTSATGWNLAGSYVTNLTFNECQGINNNSHGMNVQQASNIKINGGQWGAVNYAGQVGSNGRSGTGSGINVYAGLTGIYVNDAQCNGNASYGLIVDGPTGLVVNGGNMVGNTSGAISGAANATRISGVNGFNPQLTGIAAPAVPTSGTTITNGFGVDCDVYIVTGTGVAVFVNGVEVIYGTPVSVFLPAGVTIKLTYTAAPTWVWMGR